MSDAMTATKVAGYDALTKRLADTRKELDQTCNQLAAVERERDKFALVADKEIKLRAEIGERLNELEEALRSILNGIEYAEPNSPCRGMIYINRDVLESASAVLRKAGCL